MPLSEPDRLLLDKLHTDLFVTVRKLDDKFGEIINLKAELHGLCSEVAMILNQNFALDLNWSARNSASSSQTSASRFSSSSPSLPLKEKIDISF